MDVETLRQRVKPFEQFWWDSGGEQWGDKIDPKKLANAKKAHNRDEQEYIFCISDFTVWGSAKKSVIATKEGISAKYADDLQPLFIAWKDIYHVQKWGEEGISLYSGGKAYYLKMFQPKLKDGYLALLEELINEETSPYEAEVSALDDIINKAVRGEGTQKEITSAIEACDWLLNYTLTGVESQYEEREECSISPCDGMGLINKRSLLLVALGKTNQAKTDLLGFVDLCGRPDQISYFYNVYFDACILLSDICTQSKELDDAIVFLNLAASIEDPDRQRQAKERLQSVKELKIAFMPNSPRNSREMILCVDDIPTWPVKEFGFATSEMVRSTKWKFEIGHPQTGEMYICHPLRSDHYYEVQSFHDKLFDEKRSELVYLLESIGARHVHVEAMAGTSIETQKDGTVSSKASLDGVVTGASVEINRETHDNFRHDKVQVGIEDRELHPAPDPHIPKDLIWYPHEPSWQRIAQSALAKRYKTLSVELRYHEDFSINQKRMTKVQQALKLFTKEIGIGWNAETEERLRERKATVWKYTATFGDETAHMQESHVKDLSGVEAEYLDDLKAALSDGPLPESARKILERSRMKLGISAERAVQLEQSVKELHLTDQEKEYLQDSEDCCADGVLSDSEQRMLARRREKLGISAERALELDQMAKIKQ